MAITYGIASGPMPYVDVEVSVRAFQAVIPARTTSSTPTTSVGRSTALPGLICAMRSSSRIRLRRRALLHEPDGLEHVGDARLLLLEVGAELVAGQIGVVPALLLQHFLPGRRLHHRVDRLDERVALRRGDAGRAHHRAPIGDVEVDALLIQRRRVDAFDALRR